MDEWTTPIGTPIRTLIADDEPLARQKLHRLLSADDRVELLGVACDGMEAVDMIRSLRPDVVFLDIQMPGIDGFEVIRQLEEEVVPAIVFVSAYDQYAIDAFRVHAVDYLLKPVDPVLVTEAVDRIAERLATHVAARWSEQVRQLLDTLGTAGAAGRLPAPDRTIDRIAVRSKGRIIFVRVSTVDWIEAADNYVRLHAAGQSHIVRERISALEQRLDPQRFVRVHRSTIVNVDSIVELQPWTSGEMIILMKDGARLKLSRSYRDRLVRRTPVEN